MKNEIPWAVNIRRDVRVGSPWKLFRALQDILEEQGYTFTPKDLSLHSVPINDIARFREYVLGKKDLEKWRWWMLGIGMFLLLMGIIVAVNASSFIGYLIGTIFGIIGIVAIFHIKKDIRRFILIEIEGEAYRAEAGHKGKSVHAEVLGIISDVEIRIKALVSEPKDEYGFSRPLQDKEEIEALKKEVEALRHKVDSLLPELEIPMVKRKG